MGWGGGGGGIGPMSNPNLEGLGFQGVLPLALYPLRVMAKGEEDRVYQGTWTLKIQCFLE